MEASKILTFTDLNAWQEGHRLVLFVYEITKEFPKDEIFGLTNQIRRAVISITSNIAEGFSRQSPKEKVQFYATALGSLAEVQNQLLIAKDVEYIKADQYASISSQAVCAHKLINGLIKATRNMVKR